MSQPSQVAPTFLPWEISLFLQGMCTVRPSSANVKSVVSLTRMFASPPWRSASSSKKNLPCWSPALYGPGATRKNVNVLAISALVYDYDSPGWSASRMAKHLESLGCAFAVHTTWSHEDDAPRYRVILFLDRPLKPGEFKAARLSALERIGYTDGVDDLKDIARHYALPVRRTASPYESYLETSAPPLCVASLMTNSKQAGAMSSPQSVQLRQGTPIQCSVNGPSQTVEQVIAMGPGKYKCHCPFESGSSFGSAFIRVCKDNRVFVQCTSERHTHEGRQFWLKDDKGQDLGGEKKSRPAKHSVIQRKELLEEIPDQHIQHAEGNLSFNFPQGVFYRREKGAWQIQSPLRKETVVNHLIGRLDAGMDIRHVSALVDHILSRQVYGFDCDSSRGPIIPSNVGPKLNLYAHPEIEPAKGDWPRIQQVLEVLCDGNKEAIKWVLHWSASLVQRPERRSMVAVLCLSPQQGIGKSMYGRILAEIIGRKNSSIVSNRSLRDSFNASYVTRLLVLADEVGMSGRDADVIAALKAYITDDRVPCRAPYATRTEIDNRMTWWLTSNERKPLMLEEDDRRFTVLLAGKAEYKYRRMLSGCFNPALGQYSKSFAEEVRGFAHALHSLQVDYRLTSKPFDSKARRLIQAASRSSLDAFIEEVRRLGPAAVITDYPPSVDFSRIPEALVKRAVPCELLYGSYLTWCLRHGRRDNYQEANLRLAVSELDGVTVERVKVGGQFFYSYLGLRSKTPSSTSSGKVIELTSK